MPRVLRIINRLNLGGPTYNVALLTKHLQPDYETVLVAGQKEVSEAGSEFIVKRKGIRPVYVPNMHRSINPAKDYAAYRYIKNLILQHKPHIVHTHAAKAGALGRLAARECGVPVLVHTFHGHVFHSYFNPLKTRFFLEAERALAKISNRIVAISDRQKKELAEVYKVCHPDKIATIPLGFDLERFETDLVDKRIDFRHKYKIADDEIAIGIVGRLVPIKNHDLFLNALKNVLQKTNRKVRAFIVGDGEERQRLEQLARQLNLDFCAHPEQKRAMLTFTSWIKEADEVYAGLDIVALSSLNEGTPVSLIEAQTAGKPIVSANVGGVADTVLPNQSALLTPSGDVEGFADALVKLIENETLRHEMGLLGNAHAKGNYHFTRLVGDVAQLYDEMLWQAAPELRQKVFFSANTADNKQQAAVLAKN